MRMLHHVGNPRIVTLALCLSAALGICCLAQAQTKDETARTAVTGNYNGTATNNAGENIPVTLELAEKEGAVSGMIRSAHGDFSITKGSRDGEKITLEFDADGEAGTISLKTAEDKLTGSWSAGGDGGTVEVKKSAAPAPDAKDKS